MDYRLLMNGIAILFFHFCTLQVRGHFAGSSDESMIPYKQILNNKLIEPPKLYRKKESVYYYYSKDDFIDSLSSKKVNIRNKLNIKISDQFLNSQPNESHKANEDGDMVLQAEFGVSKPKPWRKDDQLTIARNKRAEEPVDPDKREIPEAVNITTIPSPPTRKSHKINIGKRLSTLLVKDPNIIGISMPNCGQTHHMNKRIVNGKDASPGAYPWVVVILKSGDSWCSGSIINEFWILSAAHCFMHDANPSLYAIRVGTINRNEGTTYRAEKVIVHGRFHFDNMFNSDIALVKVNRKIKLGKLVNGVCLPEQIYEEPHAQNMIVVGWGQTSFENKELPTILQEVILNRITVHECARKYKIKGNIIYRSQICTWNKGRDACQGDSGSPAIEYRNKIAFQVGIVSYGSTCADELPGVYTKVSYYINWIQTVVESN